MTNLQSFAFARCSLVGCFLLSAAIPVSSLLVPRVSLVTWNLLAPEFAKPSKYPWAKENLDWDVREPRIVKELAHINADIICLQEVQVDLWEGLSSQLKELGYKGVLQNMEGDHPVANAILVRKGLKIVRTESRSRALIAVIVNEEESSSPVYLANVHLEAGLSDEAEATRFCQVRSLCKRLKNQVNKDSGGSNRSTEAPPIVITGDCNMLRESPLYSFLQTGSTIDSKGTEVHAPFWPLHDAYREHPSGPNDQMSYRSGHVLDYVWVSDPVTVLRTMPAIDAVGTLEPKEWPSADHPSDHAPIGAILSWPGAPSLQNTDWSV